MCVYKWRVAAPVSVCSEIPSFPQRLCTIEEEAIEMMKIWLRDALNAVLGACSPGRG